MDANTHRDIEERLLAKPFQVKTTDDAGAFEGHGAVFEELHPTSSWGLSPEWKDRILPGAFKRTIADHKKAGTMPVMLYMHERGNIVGAWRSAEEGKDGLVLSGQVATSARTPSGATLHELMKMGALNGLSIGFRVRKQTLDQEKKVRDILDVELAEVSIVDIPGINRARVTDVKTQPRSPEYLERVLRDAGLSRREAKAVLAEGFNALRDAAAADDGSTSDLVASIKALARSIHS